MAEGQPLDLGQRADRPRLTTTDRLLNLVGHPWFQVSKFDHAQATAFALRLPPIGVTLLTVAQLRLAMFLRQPAGRAIRSPVEYRAIRRRAQNIPEFKLRDSLAELPVVITHDHLDAVSTRFPAPARLISASNGE